MQSFVLAICGHSGAGKSTLIRAIVERLGDATTLAIDEYESVSGFPDTARWLAEGADPDAFVTPQFRADLEALRAGRPITLPDGQGQRFPAPVLLLEEPFGKGRTALRDLIDKVLWLDLPLEVALARKLQRRNPFFPWERDPHLHLAHLREFLIWYLDVGRQFYLAQQQIIMRACDHVLDGSLPTEHLAAEASAIIRQYVRIAP